MDRFEHLYTGHAREAQPSAIREICKLAGVKGMRSLAGGWPDPSLFPVEDIRDLALEVLTQHPAEALQYGTTEGLVSLREEIINRLERIEGVRARLDELVILHGSQQGMDLIARVFVDPGDIVLVALPTYFGATGCVTARMGEAIGVPEDENGLDTDVLASEVARLHASGRVVKGVYVIPNFSNPSGVVLSLDRRKALLHLASKYDFLIFEDDPYGELRFEGSPLPSLKSMDNENRVIHIRSFSKTFTPGFRLAWLHGESAVVRKLVVAKQFADACTNTFGQYLACEFIRRGMLDAAIARNNNHYRHKRDLMISALNEHFPKEIRYNHPKGGFFIFVHLPDGMDAMELLTEAMKQQVVFVAGCQFYVDGQGKNTLRLSYSQASETAIKEAVEGLGAILKSRLHPVVSALPQVDAG